MNDKLNSIISICKEHDKIKNSNIRLCGIEGISIPSNSKDIYYSKLKAYIKILNEYLEKFEDEEHVKQTFEWSRRKEYRFKQSIDVLDLIYCRSNDTLDFVAETDFLIFSPAHYITEYLYYSLTGEYWSDEFRIRMEWE